MNKLVNRFVTDISRSALDQRFDVIISRDLAKRAVNYIVR
jgi:hypothetical protein